MFIDGVFKLPVVAGKAFFILLLIIMLAACGTTVPTKKTFTTDDIIISEEFGIDTHLAEKFNQAVRDFRREVEKELRLKELLDWLADKLSKKK